MLPEKVAQTSRVVEQNMDYNLEQQQVGLGRMEEVGNLLKQICASYEVIR